MLVVELGCERVHKDGPRDHHGHHVTRGHPGPSLASHEGLFEGEGFAIGGHLRVLHDVPVGAVAVEDPEKGGICN